MVTSGASSTGATVSSALDSAGPDRPVAGAAVDAVSMPMQTGEASDAGAEVAGSDDVSDVSLWLALTAAAIPTTRNIGGVHHCVCPRVGVMDPQFDRGAVDFDAKSADQADCITHRGSRQQPSASRSWVTTDQGEGFGCFDIMCRSGAADAQGAPCVLMRINSSRSKALVTSVSVTISVRRPSSRTRIRCETPF